LNYSPTALRRSRCLSIASVRRLINKRLGGANTRCEIFLSIGHRSTGVKNGWRTGRPLLQSTQRNLNKPAATRTRDFARRHGY